MALIASAAAVFADPSATPEPNQAISDFKIMERLDEFQAEIKEMKSKNKDVQSEHAEQIEELKSAHDKTTTALKKDIRDLKIALDAARIPSVGVR